MFTYDYQGRRVCKQVYDWDPAAGGGVGDWTGPVEDRRFVYDDGNVLIALGRIWAWMRVSCRE